MDYLNDPNLQAKQQQANTAQSEYYGAQQTQMTLPDMLRDALTKKFSSSENPLISDLQSTRQGVMNDITNAPLQVTQDKSGVIFNPQQQADLINKYRSPNISKLSVLNDLFGLQTGGLQNIINATGNAYGSYVTGLGNKATMANKSVTDLLDLMKAQSGEEWKQKEYDLEKEKLAYNRSKETNDKTTEVWNQIYANADSEDDIWTAINQNDSAWRAQGIDVDQLWKWQKDLATKVGYGGVTGQGLKEKTAAGLSDKQKAAIDTVTQIGAVDQNIKGKTGTVQAQVVSTRLNLPGILGKGGLSGDDAALADLESKYFALIQNALTAIQGSRPSDYDAKMYQQKLGPSIINSPQVNEDRINNLYKLMGGKAVTLTDPSTGNIYEYSSTTDPDYIADKKKGFK